MLSVKKVWTYGLIVVTFVFLPPENWEYWFFGGKADRYAELRFRSEQHCYVIAENLLSSPIHLGFVGVKSALSSRIGAPRMEELKTAGVLPADSFSFLEVAPNSYAQPTLHTVEPDLFFSPKPLTLIAPIEADRWSMLILALVLAAAGLTYSIASLMREDDRQREATKVDYSWPKQK